MQKISSMLIPLLLTFSGDIFENYNVVAFTPSLSKSNVEQYIKSDSVSLDGRSCFVRIKSGVALNSKINSSNDYGPVRRFMRGTRRVKFGIGAAILAAMGNPKHVDAASTGKGVPATISKVGVASSKRDAVTVDKQKRKVMVKKSHSSTKLPVLTTSAVFITSSIVVNKFLKRKKDGNAEAGEGEYNTIMGIQAPTEESSAAEVYFPVQSDVDDSAIETSPSQDEQPISELVDLGKDKEHKEIVESWFERAVQRTDFVHDEGQEFEDDEESMETTNPDYDSEVLDMEHEAEEAEAAAELAMEEARIAEEEALLAEEELLLEEARLAEEEARKVEEELDQVEKAEFEKEMLQREKDAEEAWALEEAARRAEEEFDHEERRRRLALLESRTDEEEAELAGYYSVMSEEVKAATILTDLGCVTISPDPDDINYNSTFDEEFCNDYQ